jgi:uncharacterized protein YuzE
MDLQFVNAALTRAAFEPVSQLPGSTAEGMVAHENYEKVVVAALTSYPWRFASTYRQLNYLGALTNSAWLHHYQMPADLLYIRKAEVSGMVVEYERMGDKLLCDYDNTVDLIVVGTWRVPEAQWPGWFSMAITLEMEAIFLRSPANQYEEAEARAAEARDMVAIGKTEDSKLATPVDPRRSLTLEARNGYGYYRRPPWQYRG